MLHGLEPLGWSEWYRSQPEEERARIGLHRVAQALHTGWQFENILQVGLLIHAMGQRNDSTEFRYLHHELSEESQHSMMFHELVRRSQVPTRGMPRWTNAVIRPFLMLASKYDPMVLCLAALAGEEPMDYIQREQLKLGFSHPLLERIVRIHVTEEARHISFARHYMLRTVPKLGRFRRRLLSLAIPTVMYVGVLLMVHPGRHFAEDAGVPPEVVRQAYATPEARQLRADCVSRVRAFAEELGMMDGPARRLRSVLFDRPVRRAAAAAATGA